MLFLHITTFDVQMMQQSNVCLQANWPNISNLTYFVLYLLTFLLNLRKKVMHMQFTIIKQINIYKEDEVSILSLFQLGNIYLHSIKFSLVF